MGRVIWFPNWEPSMKLRPLALLGALSIAGPAIAQQPQPPISLQQMLAIMSAAACQAPPYGGTEKEYKRFIARWAKTDITSLVPVLENTCRAKYGTASRKPLYSVGLTDDDINKHDAVVLADKWMRVTVGALSHSTPSVTPADDNRPRIWAVFLCNKFAPGASCELQRGMGIYRNQGACQAFLTSLNYHQAQDGRRFTLAPADQDTSGIWWQCASKAVDTWQP
jgi:hypothetical protein